MKILIAGGGIGGLTTALCCLHHGHDVTVLEKAPTLREIGAGIQIPPNAMKVFNALGVANRLAETAVRPDAIEGRMGASGLQLFSAPLGDAAIKRWGAPYYHIHRADFVSALERALKVYGGSALRLGCDVVGYSQSDTQVTAHLADQPNISADVLIGADGIHSAIRTTMLGLEQPTFTGQVAWRAVVPMERLGEAAPARTVCAWMGRGRHCVTYRLRGGALANLVAVVERDDWTRESWTEEGRREDALADFAGWHPTITRLLEESDALFRWALYDRPPLERWTDGRVALLGDAAHPMLPSLAQGAAMAAEDAWVLATELSRPDVSVTNALKRYQRLRQQRTSLVQARSRDQAQMFHQRTNIGRLATYGPMWLAGRFAPRVIHMRQDYLYRHDVTKP